MTKAGILSAVCAALVGAFAARADVFVMSRCAPYSDNQAAYAGAGAPFPAAEIDARIAEGAFIIAAGHTLQSGWVVSTCQGSGYGAQRYTLSEEWPQSWIDECRAGGYEITTVGRDASRWLVVMSADSGLEEQESHSAPWEQLTAWIKRQWSDGGRAVTSICSDGAGAWRCVMSRVEEPPLQRFELKPSWTKMAPVIDYTLGNGYCLTDLSGGEDGVCAIFSLADEDAVGEERERVVSDPAAVRRLMEQGYSLTTVANGM